MASRESVVQRKLLDKLKDIPGLYCRKIAQSMYSHAGVPDIICCVNGDFIGLEVKTNIGKLSKLQALEGKLIEEAGGTFLVCYGERDIEYVVSILRPKAVQPPT